MLFIKVILLADMTMHIVKPYLLTVYNIMTFQDMYFFYIFIICVYVRIQFLSFLVFVQSHIPDSPELGPNAR